MIIPKLSLSGRVREYKNCSFDEIAEITSTWLFTDVVGHREMDRDILGLDPALSKGWQSMGVLHYLGLKKEFKGLFHSVDKETAINYLKENDQDFDLIIELLESNSPNSEQLLIDGLFALGKSNDPNFEQNYEKRLSELVSTDSIGGKTASRKEQVLLREILFGRVTEKQCAICHRVLPTDLLVAAHIKPRSKCSTSERTNPNVVMPVCKVGCDDLFEKGYVLIDENGVIRGNSKRTVSVDLKIIVESIEGKSCTHHNEDTAAFFNFKYYSVIEGR